MRGARGGCFALGIAAVYACGGKLVAVDAGISSSSDAGELDAAVEAGADAEAEATVACDYDASEEDPCTPPVDDLLAAVPATVTVAAGSYGAATFVATGPWASDPGVYMHYEGSSLPVLNDPEVLTYGSPQTLPFLVAASAAGGHGTITVSGHAGNITRVAQLTVNVTSCVPWPAAKVCGRPSENCGFEGDGCGGLLSCGTCSGQAPYCFLHQCVAQMPTYCPSGYGLGENGACVPCGKTKTCQHCATLDCVGIMDDCVCESSSGG